MIATRTFTTPEVAHDLIAAPSGRIVMCDFTEDSPFPDAGTAMAFRGTAWIEGIFTEEELAAAKAGARAAFATVRPELIAQGHARSVKIYEAYFA